MKSELKEQGVVEAHRLTVNRDNNNNNNNITLLIPVGYREGPHQHSVFDLQYSRNAQGEHNWVPEGESNFVLNPTLLQPQHVWLHEPTLQSCCKMSVVRGKNKHEGRCEEPKLCAHCNGSHASSAQDCPLSGRRKRKFSVPELKNSSPLRKPDS